MFFALFKSETILHPIDYTIIAIYLVGVLGVGAYFFRRQHRVDEYFVGGRNIGAGHIGFSVVATDVGGGFSIGLGGLGFVMGISGSWLLFTGLVGAWASAVFLIPKIKTLGDRHKWLTFPDFLEYRYNARVRTVAALVSGIGYAGFVGAQILAGAKLASVAFGISLLLAVVVMAGIVILYTSFGGLQAVIYTDTVQWIVLMIGLVFFALPFAFVKVGGFEKILSTLPETHLSLTNISGLQLLTWFATVVPIWFVGMTLYQRIYATRDVQTAKRAWYFAGLLEYPLLAFAGVTLGMLARVMFPQAEPEMGLPMLIRHVLPIGVVGLVMAAYFSAIMSTADSCLLASVGNFVNDLYQKHFDSTGNQQKILILSRALTVGIGILSTLLAVLFPRVLDLVLLAYAFMVSGLFVPTLAGLFWKRVSSAAAFWSILAGGLLTIILNLVPTQLPGGEPILYALPTSFLVLVVITLVGSKKLPKQRLS